jgi:putative ABC transport system ATP-binding protein
MLSVTIQANGVSKSFREGRSRVVALADVSLTVEAGQLVALMGPSGSGKSTLLAILSGLVRPDRGDVILLGNSIWDRTDEQREDFRRRYSGFVFQQYNLFPALDARQQVEIALEWASDVPRMAVPQIARETLVALGLGDKLHLRPLELSGGEKQRVAVARAMAKKPALVFADEPTAALDWANGQQVLQKLRLAAKEFGATVLLVSHDPRIIPLADRILELEDGRLKES